MASQSLQFYLERLQADELLRAARRALLPVTLTPAVLLSDQTEFQRRGEPLDVESFLDYFRPEDEPGPLVRHSRAIVLAPMGAGKSTLFQALVWEAALRTKSEEHAPLPFYLPLERLGESGEALLMNALWRVGLPISRHDLLDLLNGAERSLFFFLDPSPTFATSGAAEALDHIIREFEERWPACRWLVAMRPDHALALPPAWLEQRFYLLDPLPPGTALDHLLRELEKPVQEKLRQLVEQVPGLDLLIQRPLVAELLRAIVQQLRDGTPVRWISELLMKLLERGGVAETARVDLLDRLQGLAREGDCQLPQSEAKRLVGKSLPHLQAAGLLDRLPVSAEGEGEATFRLGDPALRKMIVWLADPATTDQPAPAEPKGERNAAPASAEMGPALFNPPAHLLAEWEEATRSHDLSKLVQLQQQLDQLRAETLHHIALAHRDGARLDEAATHLQQALALQPGNARYRIAQGTIESLRGQHEEARRTLEGALPHAPSGEGYFYLGRSYQALDWQTEAFQAFQQAARLESEQQAEAAAAAATLAPDYDTMCYYWEQALTLQPARADWHVQLGRLREANGDRQEAKLCYRQALAANGNEAEAHFYLGRLLIDEGQRERALQHLQRATAARPKEALWFVELGHALEGQDETAAEEAYRHAIRHASRSPIPFAALGSLLRRRGRLEEAYPALKQALALDGEQVDVLFEMGLLCETRGDIAQALSHYRRAAQLDPDSPTIRGQLGAVHRRLGQAEEARHWLEEALKLNPRYGPAYDELGQLAENEGNWESAVDLYRSALEEMPDNVQLRFRTGVMLLQLERPGEAVPFLEQATQALPESAEVQWHLAEALRLQGRPVEALAAYRMATRLAPDTMHYHLALARHARSMQRLDEAQRVLDRATELDGNQIEAHRLAGELALDRHEPARALASFRRALDLAPHDPTLHQGIAAIYHEMGRHDEALDYLSQAIELVGEAAPLLSEAATLHEKRGDLATAIEFLDRAIKVEPQEQTLRLHRARLLTATGQQERARRDWETILRVNPASGEALFGYGRLLQEEGRYEEALRFFERATIGDPAPAEWLLARGQLAAKLDQREEAFLALRRLLALESTGVAPQLLAAAHHTLCLLTEGEEAEKHARRAIALDMDNAQYYVTLARLQEAAGLNEEALESLERAQGLDPENAPILTDLAAYHEMHGNMWDASDCYRRAAQLADHPAPLLCRVARLQRELVTDWKEARSILEEAIAAEPDYAPAHRDLGALLLEAGQRKSAEEVLRRALEIDGDDVETLFLLGEMLITQERDEEARPLLYRGAELDPAHDRIHFLLGIIALRADQPDIALMEWQQATEQEPHNGEYQRHLGQALASLGRYNEARHAWERALDLNPADARSHFLLGQLALQQRDHQRAINAFRSAVASDPTEPRYRRAVGESWMALGQWDSALAALRGARELEEENARTHYLMAQCYENMGRMEQAIERAEAAMHLEPTATYARMLGDLRARQGAWEAAARAYQQALEQQPQDGAVCLALGRCERQGGKLDQAASWFRRAIELDPNAPLAHHLLAQALAELLRPYFMAELVRAEFYQPGTGTRENMMQEALTAARRACALEGRNPSFQTTLAQLLVMNHEPDAALAALRQVAEPSEQRAHFLALAGMANLRRGDGGRARSLLEQATRLEGDDPLIWIALAHAAEQGRDLNSALAALERAQSLTPQEPLLHYALARLSAQSGDLVRARRELESALSLRPDIPAWHRRLGDLCARAGEAQEALAAYEEAIHRLNGATREGQASPDSSGEEALIRFARGRVLVQMGRLTDAIVEMESAIKLFPEEHEWHSELALRLMEARRWIEAQSWLRSAISRAPDRPDYPLQLARAQAANEEVEEACETLRACCGRWPEYAPAWLLLGQLLLDQGEIEAAHEVLEEALKLAPDDAATHVAVGEVLRRQNKIEEADSHFRTALQLDPKNADAHVQLGRLLARAGHADRAMEAYHEAIRIDPTHHRAHYYLGRICQHLGHLPKAAIHLRRLVELSPDSHWAWAALAECCEASGELDLALEHYRRAHKVAREPHPYLFHVGRLLKDLKRYQEAIPVLRQAVKLEPGNTEAYKLLAGVSAIAFFGGRSSDGQR